MSTFPSPVTVLQQDRFRFPGMMPRDILVWRAWLRLHEKDFDRFDYNIRVGTGFDPGPSWPPEQRRNAILNTQKRVDAVGYLGPLATVFEVKDRAGLSALGQIIGYRSLWARTFPGQVLPKFVIVSARPAFDLAEIVAANDVRLDIVQPNPLELAMLHTRHGLAAGRGRERRSR